MLACNQVRKANVLVRGTEPQLWEAEQGVEGSLPSPGAETLTQRGVVGWAGGVGSRGIED